MTREGENARVCPGMKAACAAAAELVQGSAAEKGEDHGLAKLQGAGPLLADSKMGSPSAGFIIAQVLTDRDECPMITQLLTGGGVLPASQPGGTGEPKVTTTNRI